LVSRNENVGGGLLIAGFSVSFFSSFFSSFLSSFLAKSKANGFVSAGTSSCVFSAGFSFGLDSGVENDRGAAFSVSAAGSLSSASQLKGLVDPVAKTFGVVCKAGRFFFLISTGSCLRSSSFWNSKVILGAVVPKENFSGGETGAENGETLSAIEAAMLAGVDTPNIGPFFGVGSSSAIFFFFSESSKLNVGGEDAIGKAAMLESSAGFLGVGFSTSTSIGLDLGSVSVVFLLGFVASFSSSSS